MALSYEVNLWGGFQKVLDKVEVNRRILNDLLKLFQDRQALEAELASGVSKSIKKFRYDDPEGPTFHSAIMCVKEHFEHRHPIHQEISEFILKDMIRPIDMLRKDLIVVRDKLSNDHSMLTKELKRKSEQLVKAKQDYFKLWASHRESQALLGRMKGDSSLPAKQLSKAVSNTSKLEKQTQDAHKAYQAQVTSFQKFQVTYETQMKTILKSFQELDVKCTASFQTTLRLFLEKQHFAMQKVSRFDESLRGLCSQLSLSDIDRMIEANVTGEKPETLVEYEPFVSIRPTRSGASSGSASAVLATPGGASLFTRRTGTTSSSSVNAVLSSSSNSLPTDDEASTSHDEDPVSTSVSTDLSASSSSPNPRSLFSRAPSGSMGSGDIPLVPLSGSPNLGRSPPPANPLPPPTAALPSAVEPSPPTSPVLQPSHQARALYDYDAREDNEISFKVGDIINVLQSNDSGWWIGEIRGQTGMFPTPYVRLLSDEIPVDTPAAVVATVERRVCKFPFEASEANELSISPGEVLEVISTHGDWYLVQNAQGGQGLIPGNYTAPE